MHIEHIALWTNDVGRLKRFYESYFGAVAGEPYANPSKQFASCFLRFESGGRLELMTWPGLDPAGPRAASAEGFREPRRSSNARSRAAQQRVGYAHLAIAVGSEAAVDALTERLRAGGIAIVGEPRRTGDGYYESVVEDPDGNLVEITV